jgi:hypothetical protein
MGIADKRDASETANRSVEPAADLTRPGGECRRQQRPVAIHGRSIHGAVEQRKHDGHGARVPAMSPASDSRHYPSLHVQDTDRVLQVHDLGLDLYDEQGESSLVPGEHVDGSTLSVPIERFLDSNLPTGPAEPARQGVLEDGVSPVQEAGQRRPAPSQVDRQLGSKSAGGSFQRSDRQARQPTAFDP